MANLIVLLAFIFTSFMTLQGHLNNSSSIDKPISSNKVFTEVEVRQSAHLFKENSHSSNGSFKASDFITYKFSLKKFSFELYLNNLIIKTVSLHKLHCIWVI